MTRTEFINDVTLWYDLINFCGDEGCDLLEDIYDEEGFSESVQYDVNNFDEGWEDLKSRLDDVPSVCYGTFYRRNGYFDYDMLDDDYDFECYKDDVLHWAEDYDRFDDEEEENYEPDAYHYEPVYSNEADDEEDEDLKFTSQEQLPELYDLAHSKVQRIYDDEKKKKIEEEEALLRAKYEAEQELQAEVKAINDAFAVFMSYSV